MSKVLASLPVGEFYAAKSNFTVHEVSIGDYVLGGGEVAAMEM